VFRAIRAARPPRLYVAADAPRAGRADEAERCARVREIATAVDWPCEVRTLFQTHNQGCKKGVAGAISWFFEHEPEGLVLEDDILPVPGFFAFADEMLERYRDEPRVGAITATNMIGDRLQPADSYFFTRANHVWGWASWRRVWAGYDLAMAEWPAWDASGGLLRHVGGQHCVADYWRRLFRKGHENRIDTWDYQWQFSLWKRGLLTVMPQHNLMTNLGFGPDATHTTKDAPAYIGRNPARDLPLPLRHPAQVAAHPQADALVDRFVTGLTHTRCAKFALKRWLGLSR